MVSLFIVFLLRFAGGTTLGMAHVENMNSAGRFVYAETKRCDLKMS